MMMGKPTILEQRFRNGKGKVRKEKESRLSGGHQLFNVSRT
jgi:hypothetical protein